MGNWAAREYSQSDFELYHTGTLHLEPEEKLQQSSERQCGSYAYHDKDPMLAKSPGGHGAGRYGRGACTCSLSHPASAPERLPPPHTYLYVYKLIHVTRELRSFLWSFPVTLDHIAPDDCSF